MCNNLRKLRRERDVSQDALAKAVGTTRQTIIAIEKGHNRRSSDELMVKIADYFGVPASDIFFTPLVTHMLQKRNTG